MSDKERDGYSASDTGGEESQPNDEPPSAEPKAEVVEKNGRFRIEVIAPNRCPVTHLDYEVPAFRSMIESILREAVAKGKTIIYFQIDMTNLKGLNDALTHDGGDSAIREFAEMLSVKLDEYRKLPEVSKAYFYRPKAGGDEFKGFVILDRDEGVIQDVMRELGEVCHEPFEFPYYEQVAGGDLKKKDWFITASCGIVSYSGENSSQIQHLLQHLEGESAQKLIDEQNQELKKLLEQTLHDKQSLPVEVFIQRVVENWGHRRIPPQILAQLLWILDGKVTARDLGLPIIRHQSE
jgi:GGDEF domain-containing protein